MFVVHHPKSNKIKYIVSDDDCIIHKGGIMHINRTLYSLEEYQAKIEKNSHSFSLLLHNEEKKQDFYLKPKPRSMWHEDFQMNYLKPRMEKLKAVLKTYQFSMFTLTYWTERFTPEEAALRHKHDINLFCKNMRKHIPHFRFSYVVEVTENLMVHFHIFMDKKIKQSLVKQVWFNITGSYIVHKKYIWSNKGVVNYVNKYVAKIADGNAEKLRFMYKHIDRFFGSSVGFFSDVVKDDKKEVYKLISYLYSDMDFTALLRDEKLEGKLLDADTFAYLMTKQRKGFRFVYDDHGNVYGEMKHFDSSDDMIDFWINFTQVQGLSFQEVYNTENMIYWHYKK